MFDWHSLLIIIGKSATIYIVILVGIRLFGKKELAQLSVVDLVFILLISNSVQNAMVGNDNTVMGGIAAAFGLFLINYIFKFIMLRSEKFSKLVQGEAVLLIYNGKIIEQNLQLAMISKEELDAAVREHGVPLCSDVNLAVMEIDGNISVISDQYQHKTSHKHKGHRAIRKTQ